MNRGMCMRKMVCTCEMSGEPDLSGPYTTGNELPLRSEE